MQTIKGTVSKIKILKLSTSPLVRFTVDDISCLIVAHSLNFLADVQDGSSIVLGGFFNKRGQFVVKKYCILSQEVAV